MQQLGYSDQSKHVIYWLLPGKNLGDGLRIVDCDTDTLHMTAVVPKFQYFQLFVDHKDMAFDNVMDDIHVSGTPELPLVLSPKSHGFSSGIRGSPRFKVKAHKGRLNQCHAGSSNEGSSSVPPVGLNVGHELRRSRRKLVVEEEIPNENDSDSDSDDSEWDSDWVDSDNEVGKDDDDLYEEWVDEKFEKKKKKKSEWEQDSDYDTDELQELQGSELEDSDSAEEVEVVDAQGRKK